MTKKEGLIEFYKENHKEGDLFFVISKRRVCNTKNNELRINGIKKLTELEELLKYYNNNLSYDSWEDDGLVTKCIIDCYFSTKEQEDFKYKHIFRVK